MQYPSVVQNTCRIVISHLSAVRNTAVLSQLRRVPGCRGVFNTPHRRPCGSEWRSCYGWFLGATVRDTDMFSPPMGGVCGAYAIRPYTCYMPYIEIRPCFSNGVHVIHRNTNVFPVPGAHYASKYGNVFRTGHALPIEIRPCFPN